MTNYVRAIMDGSTKDGFWNRRRFVVILKEAPNPEVGSILDFL